MTPTNPMPPIQMRFRVTGLGCDRDESGAVSYFVNLDPLSWSEASPIRLARPHVDFIKDFHVDQEVDVVFSDG